MVSVRAIKFNPKGKYIIIIKILYFSQFTYIFLTQRTFSESIKFMVYRKLRDECKVY